MVHALRKWLLTTMVCMIGTAGVANAALEGRDEFGLPTNIEESVFLYDTELNVTWLRDANYADTINAAASDYRNDGATTWPEAMSFTQSLQLGGRTGWRLPTSTRCDETTCVQGELQHLWTTTLSNSFGQAVNVGPFTNVVLASDMYWNFYWTQDLATDPHDAINFMFQNGQQSSSDRRTLGFMLIVRNGEILPVPEPAGIWLAVVGLALIAFRVRGAHISPSCAT